MDNNISKIIQILIDTNKLDLQAGKVDLNCKIDNFRLNSISLVKFIINIENEFDIEFDDEALFLEKYNTLDDLVKYICSLI